MPRIWADAPGFVVEIIFIKLGVFPPSRNAAEAGSRELDLEIWGNHVAVPRSPRPWKLNVTPPAYTTSIDAITALIGEKLPGWVKGYQDDPDGARAILANPETLYARWSTAKTAPLALCIAMLRAIKEGADG